MYERTWLKTECKRLPEPLDRELERRLGMERKCGTCKHRDLENNLALIYHNIPEREYSCKYSNELKWMACVKFSHWESIEEENPFNTQIGGSHYKDFAIQPAEFITKNKLTWLEGCVVKRICRKKNRLEDLQKAKHEIDLIIKLEGLC